MTITERLELIRAGYTKEEINLFETGEEPPEKKDQEPPEKKDPEPPKEKDPEQKPPKEKDPEQPAHDDSAVLKAINDLTKAIQLQNLQKIGLNSPGGTTAEEALAAGVFGNKTGGK